MHERLQVARKAAGYSSARSAAIAFGWSYTTYAGHENGSRGFEREAQRYAQAFSVSLEWLILGRGSMKQGGGGAEIYDIWDRIPERDRQTAKRMLEGLAQPKTNKDK